LTVVVPVAVYWLVAGVLFVASGNELDTEIIQSHDSGCK
jgi:hypothetical protein